MDLTALSGELARELGANIRISRLDSRIPGQNSMDPGDRPLPHQNPPPRGKDSPALHDRCEPADLFPHREFIDSAPEGILDNLLYRSGVHGVIDRAAYQLAAELVIPKAQVERMVRRLSKLPASDVARCMADEFAVTVPAMKRRLPGLFSLEIERARVPVVA